MAVNGLPAEGRELAGQVALVTGGARNIGRAISLALAAAGAAVAVNTLRSREEAEAVVRDLFAHYRAAPADLPPEWQDGLSSLDEAGRLRRIADYIAGMTDRYALIEHARHFASTPDLR